MVTRPKSPLWESAARGSTRSRICSGVSSSMRGPSSASMTSCGRPMSAITTSPAYASAGGSTSGSFGAARVTVIVASMQSPIRCGVSADTPLGRSIDTIGISDALTSATTVSIMPVSGDAETGPEDRIDDQRTLRDLGEMQLPTLLVADLHDGQPKPAQDVEIRPCVASHIGERTDDEHERVNPPLQQRAGDDEPVASVVPASTEHRDTPREPLFVRGFDRGNDLAARVLHQHERWNSDLIDGVAVGLAHLRGGKDAHQETGGQEQNRLRSP